MKEKREAIHILILCPLYWRMTLQQRLEAVHNLAAVLAAGLQPVTVIN